MQSTQPYRALSLFCLTVLPFCTTAQLQLVNTGREGIARNNVQLECRDQYTKPLRGAMVWLNELSPSHELRALVNPDEVIEDSSGQITFVITRELEGTYYCGRNLDNVSAGLELIVYPDSNIKPSKENRFYAKVDTTARLNCSILPGALTQQYFVIWSVVWKNSSSMVEVARTSPSLQTTDPRFTVDEETLALVINNVRFMDSGSYQCILGVREPLDNGQKLYYPQTESVDLNLKVYEHPFITKPPQNSVIALNSLIPSQNATFHCEARGKPIPEIVWFHNGASVNTDSGKYSVNTISKKTMTGDFIVTSVLTVNILNAYVGGDMKCKVVANDEDIGSKNTSASATLAVIGGLEEINLHITTNKDIFFELKLPSAILVPVQLYIYYIDANNRERRVQRLTTATYFNVSKITHFEPSSRVPANEFPRIGVEIALRHRNKQGPTKESALEYDLDKPTIFTEAEANVQIAKVMGVTITIVVIAVLAAIVIPVLVCICNRMQLEKSRLESKEAKRQKEETLLELERLREEDKTQLQLLKEGNDHEEQLLREKYESELSKAEAENKRLQEKMDVQLKTLKELNEHKQRMKMLEIIGETCKQQKCKKIVLGSDMTITLTTENTDTGTDMTDGGQPHYEAHANDQSVTLREEVESSDECLVDCMKSIVTASMNDSKLGPVLKSLITTD